MERSVRYVKEDFLYGDHFVAAGDVQRRSVTWLNDVANVRTHSVTKQRPVDMFEAERPLLSQRYAIVDQTKRPVDKTGLLSFEGNKYSAPSVYQRRDVAVESSERLWTKVFLTKQRDRRNERLETAL